MPKQHTRRDQSKKFFVDLGQNDYELLEKLADRLELTKGASVKIAIKFITTILEKIDSGLVIEVKEKKKALKNEPSVYLSFVDLMSIKDICK